jgi:hypothetical protein
MPSNRTSSSASMVGPTLIPTGFRSPRKNSTCESALTRELPVPAFAAARPGEKGFYCTSAHFVWIGDRLVRVNDAQQPDELIGVHGRSDLDPDRIPESSEDKVRTFVCISEVGQETDSLYPSRWTRNFRRTSRQQPDELIGVHGRSDLDPDRIPESSEELDVCAVEGS